MTAIFTFKNNRNIFYNKFIFLIYNFTVYTLLNLKKIYDIIKFYKNILNLLNIKFSTS